MPASVWRASANLVVGAVCQTTEESNIRDQGKKEHRDESHTAGVAAGWVAAG
jgi:hypothetical protein